jgi:hypothetical protein
MKYWVYLNGEVPGSYDPEELAGIPGVEETTMVCPAEGGIEERNWLRAGQFPEIVDALRRAERAPISPEAPVPRPDVDPARPLDPNDILNDSSSRLFRHVSDLMKELENRRAERAMTQSLQRQVVELKNEILAMRERNQYLQDRADLIPGFQEREERLEKDLESTRQRLQEREARLRAHEGELGKTKEALESAKKGEESLSGELKRQAQILEDMSQQLAQKEFTLAKAFGVIRRLEEVLGDLLPSSVSGISEEVPGYKSESAPPPPPPPQNPLPEEPTEPPVEEPEIKVRRETSATPGDAAETAPPPETVSQEPPVQSPVEPEPPETGEKTEAGSEPEIHVRRQESAEMSEAAGDIPAEPEDTRELGPAGTAAPEDAGVPDVLETGTEPRPDPMIQDLVSSSYTADTGEADKPVDLPPEGEVTPVPPPWTKLVERFSGFMKKTFGGEENSPGAPENDAPRTPPPPPEPGDKNNDQN